MESQTDLEEKIALYNTQLGQVDELLKIDSTNAEFLKLKEDLQNLISLTKVLLVQVINNGIASSTVNVASVVDNNTQKTTTSTNSVSFTMKQGAIEVGEVVEVLGGERPYAGVVTGIINNNEYKIKYFEYETEVSLPLTSLQRLTLSYYTSDQVYLGLLCQCKYNVDQNYYDCKVTSLTPNGCIVTYTAYNNTEEVPLAYLKPITTTIKPNPMSGKNTHKAVTSGGLIPIPDSLTILPTDTEKEIEKKKKELKSIKNKNRLIEQETTMVNAQNSWKKFVHKGTKRPDSGIAKTSMFSSTEEVSGKVGVVNSGRKMTDFQPRKKHKFDTF